MKGELNIGFFSLIYQEGIADMIYFFITRPNDKEIKAVFYIPYFVNQINQINYDEKYLFADDDQYFIIDYDPKVNFIEDRLDKVSVHLKKMEICKLIDILNKGECYSYLFSQIDSEGLIIGAVDINRFDEVVASRNK